MTFQKPKYKQKTSSSNISKDTKEILEAVIKANNQQEEVSRKGYEMVGSTLDKYLETSATYYYYLLSLDAACIGFTISLTIHEKIAKIDIPLFISLIFWILSFYFGMISVIRTNKLRAHSGFRFTGEIVKSQKVIDEHQKIVEELGTESTITKKSPLFYLVLGLLAFFIWYILKIISN
jgi:hypothetical protein